MASPMATNDQVPMYPITHHLVLGARLRGGTTAPQQPWFMMWKATAYNNPMGLENRPVDDGTTPDVALRGAAGEIRLVDGTDLL